MTQDWRGVAAEDLEEVDATTGLRLAARSRRLLGSLLRPQLRGACGAAGLLITDQVALLAGPLLIAAAIDRGIPAAVDGRPGPLLWCIAGYAVAGVADAMIEALRGSRRNACTARIPLMVSTNCTMTWAIQRRVRR